jgi:hypothetical protein
MEHGAAMPLARSEHAVAELNGKIWVLGGYPPGRLPSNLVQIYDPAQGRWSLGPALPQPIHHTTVKAGQRQALCDRRRNRRREHWTSREIRGGRLGSRSAVGGWVKRAPMPTPRSGGGSAVIDGKIYVAGGRPPGAPLRGL